MGIAAVRTQHFQAVLLFGTPADIRSQTKLPWHDSLFLVAPAALRQH
jgi:hypothetical protein